MTYYAITRTADNVVVGMPGDTVACIDTVLPGYELHSISFADWKRYGFGGAWLKDGRYRYKYENSTFVKLNLEQNKHYCYYYKDPGGDLEDIVKQCNRINWWDIENNGPPAGTATLGVFEVTQAEYSYWQNNQSFPGANKRTHPRWKRVAGTPDTMVEQTDTRQWLKIFDPNAAPEDDPKAIQVETGDPVKTLTIQNVDNNGDLRTNITGEFIYEAGESKVKLELVAGEGVLQVKTSRARSAVIDNNAKFRVWDNVDGFPNYGRFGIDVIDGSIS